MGKYFGTDGYRGEANGTLSAEQAFRAGQFLGWYYGELKRQNGASERARVVIGKDPRLSSYMLEDALSAGLTSSGADVFLLHVTTTPSVSFIARTEDFDCGIMISASHNPYYDNGIKLVNGMGEKMSEAVTELIEAYLDRNLYAFGKSYGGSVPPARRERIGRTVDYFAGRNRYIGYLVSLATCSYRGKRIGLDCANGSAFMIAPGVFNALGAKTYPIHDAPDGVNINRGAGSTHVEALRALVREKGLDIGFAFDGDADRCICVDEKGNVADGDSILYLCARHLKERGELERDAVVTTVMSNFGLSKALGRLGIRCETTQVGDRFVYESMLKNGYSLGGEQSGHIIFSKYATTGDGILTAIQVMEILAERELPLSALTQPFQKYPQVLKNVRTERGGALLEEPKVLLALRSAEQRLFGAGRMLVRASGTEPLVRVMAEGESFSLCEDCVGEVVAALVAAGGEL